MFIIEMIAVGTPGQVSTVEAATNIKLNKTNAVLIKGQTVQLKLNGAQGKVTAKSKEITVKNGATINFTNYDSIYVNYHTTRKPANYVSSSQWYGTVKSPLHDYCVLDIS